MKQTLTFLLLATALIACKKETSPTNNSVVTWQFKGAIVSTSGQDNGVSVFYLGNHIVSYGFFFQGAKDTLNAGIISQYAVNNVYYFASLDGDSSNSMQVNKEYFDMGPITVQVYTPPHVWAPQMKYSHFFVTPTRITSTTMSGTFSGVLDIITDTTRGATEIDSISNGVFSNVPIQYFVN